MDSKFTEEYIKRCADNEGLQKSWEPRIGDAYFCTSQREVKRVDWRYSLEGRKACDIHLPFE